MAPTTSWIATRPEVSMAEAAAALDRWWDLEGELADLPSERDQNVLVRDTNGAPTHILKIANLSEDHAFLECQNLAMGRLAAAGVPVQQVLTSIDGRDIVGLGDPGPPWARVLTWLPGRTLASVTEPAAGLWADLGASMGRGASALLAFDHPAAHRTFQWDVLEAMSVVDGGLRALDDVDRLMLLGRVRQRLAVDLAPRLPGLRRSVIHNDANDHNVLVSSDGRHVVGLLDFGDMVHSVTAQEAAVACAYAMFGRRDPLDVLEHVVAGFNMALPLAADELDVLPTLILARLGMSVAISATQARLSPDPYLRVSEAPAWAILEMLVDMAPSELRSLVHRAAGR